MSAWKRKIQSSLKENIEKVGLSANYASIATVKPNNMPAVRTVVMRDFAGEHHTDNTGWNSDLLVIITDKRSDKINELKQNPNIELNW
ncbi:MAG: pyridoxamine 5'-phosphate oxidase family protein [Paenibacillus sp.]|nr:pyridoxamine 5'-phosphate oxidase family protein [Paenibacillus sp.]